MKTLKKFYNSSEVYEKMLLGQDIKVYQEYLDFIYLFVSLKSYILDAGCGIGFTTNELAKKYRVVGSEFSKKFIETARKKFPKLTFNNDDLQKLPYNDNTFEAVCSHNVIEHVQDPKKAIGEMLRVVKKNGLVIIYAPNLLSPVHPVKQFLQNQPDTYDGKKTKFGLLKMTLRNLLWIIAKRIKLMPNIIKKEIILNNFYPDQDATYYCNPIDIKNILASNGAKIISYQSIKHLHKGFLGKVFFTLFPELSGSTRITAKKV